MKILFYSSIICATLLQCGIDFEENKDPQWLVPSEEIINGGPGKDGIPAIDFPKMISLQNVSFLTDESLLILYDDNGQVKAFPHHILNWHEVVNDGNTTISYCPLTGSAIGLSNIIKEANGFTKTTFGVSGLLYNGNLILFDRQSDSYWSQMKNQSIHGRYISTIPENKVLVETSFKTLMAYYPQALVLSNDQGYYSEQIYAFYPYGDHRTSESIFFPISNDDSRLPRKERILGVTKNGISKAYRFSNFANGTSIINDSLGSSAISVIGNQQKNFMVAYQTNLQNSEIPVEILVEQRIGPVLFRDQLGNRYNIFGKVLSGPNVGDRLKPVHSYISYWFAWGAFYPDTDLN